MSGNLTHILFENASGYSLFEVNIQEEVAAKSKAVQEAVLDFSKFSRMVKLKSFLPFTSAAEALANANDVSEGTLESIAGPDVNQSDSSCSIQESCPISSLPCSSCLFRHPPSRRLVCYSESESERWRAPSVSNSKFPATLARGLWSLCEVSGCTPSCS